MTDQPASRTRTEAVHERLRADILAGRLPPGSRLGFADLQRRYAASVGVLREALVRLAGQNLVTSEPHIGFTVTPLSRESLIDLTDARVVLESIVFALAIEHGDTAWEARVLASHHVLARTPLRDRHDPAMVSEEWAAAHLAFHRALLDGCPNRRLRELADALRVSAELYRAWSQTIGAEPDRDIAGEHAALLAAVLDRDISAGGTRLAAHIRRTADNLLGLARSGDAATTVDGVPAASAATTMNSTSFIGRVLRPPWT